MSFLLVVLILFTSFASADTPPKPLPSQTGHANELLSNDGAGTLFWNTIATFELGTGLTPDLWGSDLPSIIIDGGHAEAVAQGSAALMFKHGGASQQQFMVATQDQSSASPTDDLIVATGNNSGAGSAGSVLLLAGASDSAAGGGLQLFGGNGSTSGGSITITAGGAPGTGTGGDLTLAAGSGTTVGAVNFSAEAVNFTNPYNNAAVNEFRFYEAQANGSNYVGLKAPTSISADKVWSLPSADGSANQVLSTNGSGALQWQTIGANVIGLSDGTVTAPGLAFSSDTNTGMYRVGADNLALTAGGVRGMDMINIGSSLVNFGFGGAANVSSSVPVVYDRSLNSTVTWQFGNSNQGSSSVTSFMIYNGAGSNYLFLENYAWSTASYLTYGSAIRSSANQAQLIIAQEGTASTSFIGFTVGGASAATEKMRITKAGNLIFPATMTAAGTTGARTIDKISGSVNFAAGATALVVTNNLVTTSSIVLLTKMTNDGTCQIQSAVPAAGSFTINMTAGCAAETKVGFFVVN